MNEMPILFLAVQSVLGLYGALYISTAIFVPRWFLDSLAINHVQRRFNSDRIDKRAPWWLWPLSGFTLLAVGVVVYSAVYAVVSVVPPDWGSYSEDAEWLSLRYSIQTFVAFFGAIGLVEKLENNAEVLVWAPHERRARQAVTKAIGRQRDITAEVRSQIAAAAEKELEPDEFLTGYEKRYAIDVQRHVGSGIRD